MFGLDFVPRAAIVGLFCITLIGCGDDSSSSTACVPAASQACNGAGGCLGSRICDAEGAGWSDCDCSVSPYPDAGGSTDGGSTDGGSMDAGPTDAGMTDAGP